MLYSFQVSEKNQKFTCFLSYINSRFFNLNLFFFLFNLTDCYCSCVLPIINMYNYILWLFCFSSCNQYLLLLFLSFFWPLNKVELNKLKIKYTRNINFIEIDELLEYDARNTITGDTVQNVFLLIDFLLDKTSLIEWKILNLKRNILD